MVNHTAIHHELELFDDECPGTDYGNSTVEEQDGEFEWSTSKQGWILSSFFYGYVLTQVTTSKDLCCVRKHQICVDS
jgi:MFS transporter, ACS family, solute carrier family 17 (sodium-dependent inorganic phosphate cotransporter), member 5